MSSRLEHAQSSHRNDGGPTGPQTSTTINLTIEIKYEQPVRACSKFSQKCGGARRHHPTKNLYRDQLSALCQNMFKVLTEMRGGSQKVAQFPPNRKLASKSAISTLLQHVQSSHRNEGGGSEGPPNSQRKNCIEISYQHSVRTCSKFSQK